MSSPRKIILRSSDGEPFQVDEAVALKSQTIKHMIEDDCADNGIPLPNVTSRILAKVIEYSKKHVESRLTEAANNKINHQLNSIAAAEEDLKNWDAQFVKVDQATLFDLILAANYLYIKGLLDITCQTVADMIKGKTPEEIRRTFNIKNDFTPDEEKEVRQENQWAFDCGCSETTVTKFDFCVMTSPSFPCHSQKSIPVSTCEQFLSSLQDYIQIKDEIPYLVPRDGKIYLILTMTC